ncbi:MAG: RidA family protein [Asticcacaulis sp.]|uniref:RidA family protein n=1 Tax=Asticcacaulis sp. TaxID=1872648 RepID=UPI0039E643B3
MTPLTEVRHLPYTFDAPYPDAVKVGDRLYMSGQIGNDGDAGLSIEAQTHRAISKIIAALSPYGLGLGDIVQCRVLLADLADLERFDRIYLQYFNGPRLPSRTTFHVAALLSEALVEIECTAFAGSPQ